MARYVEWFVILIIFGIIAFIGNWIGYEVVALEAIPGMLILIVVALAGMILEKIMPGNLPSVGYIALVGILVTLPVFPGGEQIAAWTNQVNTLAIATPILAYAGISIGRNWVDFTKLGWRALVVATCVFLGTFLGSAIIAEIILRWQGLI